MITELLCCLRSNKTYSLDELTNILGVSKEAVQTGLEYLERIGYIKKVSTPVSCSGHCKNCSQCSSVKGFSYPVMWELNTEKI